MKNEFEMLRVNLRRYESIREDVDALNEFERLFETGGQMTEFHLTKSVDRNCGNQLIKFHLTESVDQKF